MKKDSCVYLEEANKIIKKIDYSKPCLLKSFLKNKPLAASGICEKCKQDVSIGNFSGPSTGSLTNQEED